MTKRTFLLVAAALCILNTRVGAQSKIAVIMGSSTAYGAAASVYDSAWAGRIQRYYNQNLHTPPDTSFTNIAIPSYDTYLEMPSDFVPPPGRPSPDPNANVTKALSYHPNIVIINLPSNDIAFGYTKAESMSNFRLMFSRIRAAGAKCFITTSQPRNDLDATSRQYLRDMKDSITNAFGVYSINFWDDLVTTDGTNMLRTEVKDPLSPYHLNDYGHRLVYYRVRDKQIFLVSDPLPLKLIDFEVTAKNYGAVVQWQTATEESDTRFEVQRSADGILFESIYQTPGAGAGRGGNYTFTDNNPLPGNSYYRLRIIEHEKPQFSKIVRLKAWANEFSISKIYLAGDGTQLVAELNIPQDQQLCVSVLNANGALVHQQYYRVLAPAAKIQVPVFALSRGCYFLRISGPNGSPETKPFIK